MTSSSAPLAKLTEVSTPPTPKAEVDELDLALLRALAVDARQSQRALARAIEMSPPAVADRLARLERTGAIRGYRVDIDWAALGFPVVVYLAVTAGPGMDLSEIIRAIRAIPEAQDMSVVTGGLDLLRTADRNVPLARRRGAGQFRRRDARCHDRPQGWAEDLTVIPASPCLIGG